MSINVETVAVLACLFGDLSEAEVECVVEDGKLREGEAGIRRFWLSGYDRPFYLGHLMNGSERSELIDKVKKAFEDSAQRNNSASDTRW